MKKSEYKKTAIRMPMYIWEKLQKASDKYGVSCNSLMVLWIGEKLSLEDKQDKLTSPEAVGRIFKELGVIDNNQISLFENKE